MNKVRVFLLAAVAVAIGLVAYGWGSRPAVESVDSPGFSAERVVKDIEVISRKHHSVAHPVERAEVRDYLVSRLEQLGADITKNMVQITEYRVPIL